MLEPIEILSAKGAIQKCNDCNGQFISSIFLTLKPDGSSRFILILKKLNTFIKTEHFKRENIRTARDLMQQDCYMATMDLQDAYYVIPIAEELRKYLRFRFNNEMFEFICLPFGLSTAPYVFTKIMKPVMTHL